MHGFNGYQLTALVAPSISARESWRGWPWTVVAVAIAVAYSSVLLVRPRMPQAAPPHPPVAASGPLLPSGAIRFISIDAIGTVWFRVENPTGALDRVVAIDRDGRRYDFASLRAVVETRHDDIVQLGSLLDFWAVDRAGRVWIGPRYHDGSRWVEVARDRSYPGGSIALDERVVVDTDGTAWVPFRITRECPVGGACNGLGIAGYSASGDLVREIAMSEVSELTTRDFPPVRFVALPQGELFAVAARTAYALPSGVPIDLPGFIPDPVTGLRPAGFASAAMANGDDMAVYTWCGKVVSGPDPAVIELQRTGSTWRSFDLSASPLFRLGIDGRFITAAVYRVDGALWLASSAGEVALREGSTWTLLFTNANSPVGYPIRTMVVDGAGGLWIGTSRGALLYRGGVWHTSMTVHLPTIQRFIGWLEPPDPSAQRESMGNGTAGIRRGWR